MDQKQQKS